MITRDDKIKQLTENELRWLIDNPNELEHVTSFFAAGGFSIYTDKAIDGLYGRLEGATQ